MIPQLVQQLGGNAAAQAQVITADPLDLVWRMEQVWDAAQLWGQPPAGPARRALFTTGAFAVPRISAAVCIELTSTTPRGASSTQSNAWRLRRTVNSPAVPWA